MALLALRKVGFAGVGQNQMYTACWLKIALKKKIRVGKNKNIGLAMSSGLLVVRIFYRFYVCAHLSKWFVFVLLFKF